MVRTIYRKYDDRMNNIVLVGFMGTGKSSVGQELARRLQWPFIDTDAEVERETGLSIPDIFRHYGEGYFRKKEQDIIQRVMQGKRQVIATGGGAVIKKENRQLFRSHGIVICLRADPEVIWDRVREKDDRPLLQGREQVAKLLAERELFYRDVDLTLDTSHKAPEEVGRTILAQLGWQKKGDFSLQLIRVNLPIAGYNIFVRPGILSRVALYLPGELGKRVLVISDNKVSSLYGPALFSALKEGNYQPTLKRVAEGEGAKELSVVADLYQASLSAGIERHCPIIALGGGVVGDLAGFVAATFMRGVPFIQIPTTLLAQVDSSIGGKVGVNLPQGKNLVGSFYQPRAVLIDPTLLQSLPPREVRAGLAEVVKYGLVFSPELYHLLEREVDRFLALDPHITTPVIAECCRLKTALVERDEREEYGHRMLLNFGHNIGHAVERASGYGTFRHGEAVAIGIAAACYLSVKLGLLNPDIFDRVKGLLERIGLSTHLYGININAVYGNLIYDKKAREQKIPFILLKDLGKPVIFEDVPREIITAVLKDLGAGK
jgi:shikimate kinase/3-dehydroquinate synthase